MAAKGKPVLLDNWEDLEEAGDLREQVELRKQQVTASMNGETSSCQNSGGGPVEVLFTDETRARCSLPPVPVIKILKRPSPQQNTSMGGGDGLLLNDDVAKPRVPVKSLQQREEEYAQARLRILGEAQSPEEDLSQQEDEKVCRILNKLELMGPNSRLNYKDLETGEQNPVENSLFSHEECSISNIGNEVSNPSYFASMPSPSNSTEASPSYYYNVNSVVELRNDESSQLVRVRDINVIRQPKGPDGTIGFGLRR